MFMIYYLGWGYGWLTEPLTIAQKDWPYLSPNESIFLIPNTLEPQDA